LDIIEATPLSAHGIVLSEKARQNNRPLIYAAASDRELAMVEHVCRFADKDIPIYVIPAWDCLAYDRVSPSPDIVAKRIAKARRLFGSHTTHILNPKTVSSIFLTRFLRCLSAGGFSFVTLPQPLHFSVDSISEASSRA